MTKAALLQRVEELNDAMGANMYDAFLLSTYRAAEAAATQSRVRLLACARHAGAGTGSPQGAGQHSLNILLGNHAHDLQHVVAAQALASLPEVAEARRVIEPLEAELKACQDALNAIELEASIVRQQVAAEIERAEQRALNSKGIVELRDRLAALNG